MTGSFRRVFRMVVSALIKNGSGRELPGRLASRESKGLISRVFVNRKLVRRSSLPSRLACCVKSDGCCGHTGGSEARLKSGSVCGRCACTEGIVR